MSKASENYTNRYKQFSELIQLYMKYFISLFFLCQLHSMSACTIFCSTDSLGNTFVGNNEDSYIFTNETGIKIVGKTDSTKAFGFFYYTNRKKEFPQGGFNESGLFFDANSIPWSNLESKKELPQFKNGAIGFMKHFLSHCSSVSEVIKTWKQYQINGLSGGQLHLVDKFGNKGIITNDSAWVSKKPRLVSTNFDLSQKILKPNKCWRYPIADSMITSQAPSLELMFKTCKETKQEATVYSTIHNLNSGEIWIAYGQDFKNPYKTTLNKLLNLGDTTILFRQLLPLNITSLAIRIFNQKGINAALSEIQSLEKYSKKEKDLGVFLFAQSILFNINKEKFQVEYVSNDKIIQSFISNSSSTLLFNWMGLRVKKHLNRKTKKLLKEKLKSL